MDVILKWIGGGTVAAALVLAGVAIGGTATAEGDSARETPLAETSAAPAPASATRFDAHGAIAAKAVADAERLYTVRRILLHMFRETAHHSGHADLIRESIDGQSTTKTLAADAIRSYERS